MFEHLFDRGCRLACFPVTRGNGKERDEALARLAATLGAGPADLDAVSPLDARDLARLDALVVDALERDEARVTEAVEETVRFVPRPLRGRAKKMLFPEDR